jgi:hypothetical protein
VALQPGTRIGTYEITAQIGAGGMGEVYRAIDSTLGRHVALKVLPHPRGADGVSVARLAREAKMLAALNHPNIAQIYGFETVGGITAIVMELVEGPTLADRIARGPLAVDDALKIARQIAEALEAAHEQGIIHRDLKPGNVKLRPDGLVKVLDFGLAKALEPPAAAIGASQSPTGPVNVTITSVGVVLGTPAYMAPEQARGEAADTRSDIWAFGCVLFEMLTGRSPFAGKTVAETMAQVIESAPAFSALPATTPPLVRRLIQRCLQKDQRERLHHIGDGRLDLGEALIVAAAPTRAASRSAWVMAAAAVAAIGAGGVGGWAVEHFRPDLAEPGLFAITPPPGASFAGLANPNFGGFALSPDGRTVAFVATLGNETSLWLRPLDGEPRRIAGTDFAAFPFWSPDGKSVGFGSGSRLLQLDVASGTVTPLAGVINFAGGAWLSDGRIVFGGWQSPLFELTSNGTVRTLTKLDTASGEVGHRFPQWVDGDRLLYHGVNREPAQSALYGISLARPLDRVPVMKTTKIVLYAGSGRLLSVDNGALLSHGLNPVTFARIGDLQRVTDRVTGGFDDIVNAAVSRNGRLLFDSSPAAVSLRWFDASGKVLGQLGGSRSVTNLDLSSDGRVVAVAERDRPLSLTNETGLVSPVTSTQGAMSPVLSPDSNSLILSITPPDTALLNLFRVDARSGAREQVARSPNLQFASDWSRDGSLILYSELAPDTSSDVWVLPVSAAGVPVGRPRAIRRTPATESWAVFSPEREPRWIAYQSDERGGRYEVYMCALPECGQPFQISESGAVYPRWGPEGLYYAALDTNTLVHVRLQLNAGVPVVLSRRELFPVSPIDAQASPFFDVTPDGTRFLVRTTESPPALTLLMNWPARLETQ